MVARRPWLAVQTLIMCLIPVGMALANTPSDLGPAVPPVHALGFAHPPSDSTRAIRLQNNTWRQVKVEVRVGPDKACDALGTLGVVVLQQGQEWTVQFDDPVICWRRDQTPGDPASNWTAWNQAHLASSETRIAIL